MGWAGLIEDECEGWERRSQAKTSPFQGEEENILGQDWVGQPDPGAGLKGGWGWGWKASSSFSNPPPPYLSSLELWLSPGGSLGLRFRLLCRAAFSIGFPLPSSSNL